MKSGQPCLQAACCRAPCKLPAGMGEDACLTWRRLVAQYGRIRNIDLKILPRPPAFAFVEFENPRCVGSILAGGRRTSHHAPVSAAHTHSLPGLVPKVLSATEAGLVVCAAGVAGRYEQRPGPSTPARCLGC